ncbi:MAG: tRNA (adenosine(37)-N6)-dimethylallyltransferase MiaA [candidate division Zixibacteria bacterium RBG_16_53_22]|nr:MAG: tRNA (adenosine(37)-N6)-dimethylallyltransferase MiaA [candidate division Zixibacteria bacterium RBG_16_53_22]
MTSRKSSDGNNRPRAIIICGPTGSGKSDLGFALAEKYGGRIISADSRQIYRRLDIGTAKPSLEDRARIIHYMIDVADIDEVFTARRYSAMAMAAINETCAEHDIPFIVGGAGLYLAALTRGIFEGPSADPNLRHDLEAEADKAGQDYLHRQLSRIDPEAARRISPGDRARLIRALEVFRLTGKKISELQSRGYYERLDTEFLWIGVTPERKRLYERINRRVDRMVTSGLVDEIAGLKNDGLGNSIKQKRIVGYYEILEALEGLITMEEAIDLVKQHSRNYAKRQLTWFRHQACAKWLDPDANHYYNEVSRIIDDYLK